MALGQLTNKWSTITLLLNERYCGKIAYNDNILIKWSLLF